MSRILKIMLIEVAIVSLVALVVCFAGPGKPASPATVWDYEHHLIHLTDPPQDLKGNFLSSPRIERFTDDDTLLDQLKTPRKSK